MTSYFSGKVFLVTGASSGIGRALACELVDCGAEVLAMARNLERLEALREEKGLGIHPFQGDVTSSKACREAVEKAFCLHQRLDGLIHNAGVSMRGLAHESRPDVFRSLMDVNFYAMIDLFQAAYPHLVASKGHLAAISSVMGRYATHQRSGYCASKHAIQGFMDSVRLETMDKGIHTLVVSPGFVNTEVAKNALGADGQALNKNSDSIINGLSPNEVAKKTLRAMQHRKRDIYPAGAKEKLGLILSRFAPGVLDRLLRNIRVT